MNVVNSALRSPAAVPILGVACAWLACAPACVSSSVSSDVERVRELTRVERIARVADQDVDPASSEEARRLLAQPLDADAAVRVALLDNRELRATLRELGVPRGRLIQAGLLPNPRAEAEILPERNSRLALRVEYDVTQAVMAPFRARAAAPALEAARCDAAAAVIELGQRVRIAFYRSQGASQRLAIAQTMREGAAARRDAARAMGEAGNVAALDVATAEAAFERANVSVATLELEVLQEHERLGRLMGAAVPFRTQGTLPRVPDAPDADDRAEDRAVQASFELRAMQHRAEGLARQAGVTRAAGWVPDAVFDVHGLYGNPDNNTPRDWRFGGGVNLSVPIFDRDQGTVTALRAELEAELERYHGKVLDIRSQAREARSRLLSAHARARQYQEVIVPAQQRVMRETLLQYNAMQIGVFQLLQAQREELDVELAHADALREYWSAVAALQALLAGGRVASDGHESHGESMDRDASRSEGN
jgi:outer membrane protein TolC